jgi:hypothetical protein
MKIDEARGDDETGGADRDAPLQRRRADGTNTAASDADMSDSVKTGIGIDASPTGEDQIVRARFLAESDGAADECNCNDRQRQALHAIATLSSAVGGRPARLTPASAINDMASARYTLSGSYGYPPAIRAARNATGNALQGALKRRLAGAASHVSEQSVSFEGQMID